MPTIRVDGRSKTNLDIGALMPKPRPHLMKKRASHLSRLAFKSCHSSVQKLEGVSSKFYIVILENRKGQSEKYSFFLGGWHRGFPDSKATLVTECKQG